MSAVCATETIEDPGDRFAAAVMGAVKGGGDTDTVAAVAGAMSGAVNGIHAIRDRWRRQAFVRLRTGYGGVDHEVTIDDPTILATPRWQGQEDLRR